MALLLFESQKPPMFPRCFDNSRIFLSIARRPSLFLPSSFISTKWAASYCFRRSRISIPTPVSCSLSAMTILTASCHSARPSPPILFRTVPELEKAVAQGPSNQTDILKNWSSLNMVSVLKVEKESSDLEPVVKPLIDLANTEHWRGALNVLYLNGGVLNFLEGTPVPVLISLRGTDEGVEEMIDLLMGKAKADIM